MDHLAAAKWLPKTEQDIKPEIDLHFNPFSAKNPPVFPSPSNENAHQILNPIGNPKTRSSVLNSYHSLNVISFAGGKTNSPSKNTYEMCKKSNGHVESEAVVDVVTPVEINFSVPAPVHAAPGSLTSFEEYYGVVEYDEAMKSGGKRTTLQSQEHILAERKRREKLSKNFVALSAIVPGLKKLDKASVLDGAIKYVKELEIRIKNNEENNNSSVIRKRNRQCFSDDTFSSSEEKNPMRYRCSGHGQPSTLPDIDVKISGENVLIRIYCEKMDGIIKQMLYHVENLNLSVVTSTASVFGKFNLYMVIAAEMDDDFCMTAEGLAENIRQVLS